MVAGSISLKDALVKEYLVSNFGEDAYAIVLALDRSGKTDEGIAKKVPLKVNEIRANLNRLHYAGIIYYTKEKAETSNWYTYTWFVKKERIAELIKERYQGELDELRKKLDYENTYTFFKCKKGCSKLPFELAFEYDFRCPECGGVMKSFSNDKEKRELKNKIKQIEKFLAEEQIREDMRREERKKQREKAEKKEEKSKEKSEKKVDAKKKKVKKTGSKKRVAEKKKKGTKKKAKKDVKKKVKSPVKKKENKKKGKTVKKKNKK